MSIQEIKSKLINLFINVKIRKEDEVKIIFKKIIIKQFDNLNKDNYDEEIKKLNKLTINDIINYIFNSIDILINLKAEEKYQEKIKKDEENIQFINQNYTNENDKNGLKLYENILIKTEKEIREHVKIEQQLKIKIEEYESEIDLLKRKLYGNDYNIKDIENNKNENDDNNNNNNLININLKVKNKKNILFQNNNNKENNNIKKEENKNVNLNNKKIIKKISINNSYKNSIKKFNSINVVHQYLNNQKKIITRKEHKSNKNKKENLNKKFNNSNNIFEKSNETFLFVNRKYNLEQIKNNKFNNNSNLNIIDINFLKNINYNNNNDKNKTLIQSNSMSNIKRKFNLLKNNSINYNKTNQNSKQLKSNFKNKINNNNNIIIKDENYNKQNLILNNYNSFNFINVYTNTKQEN